MLVLGLCGLGIAEDAAQAAARDQAALLSPA
jgi:hypothetical protein